MILSVCQVLRELNVIAVANRLFSYHMKLPDLRNISIRLFSASL
jgi:hypothetical protein